MTLRPALCFAAAAVLLPFPAAVFADGALITAPFAASHAAIAAPTAAVLVPSVVSEPVEVLPPQEAGADAGDLPVAEWGGDLVEAAAEEDLWQRIRTGFAMEEIDSPLVQRHEAWYLNRPEYVGRMIDRSRRYLYHIVAEVEKRGMPMEIALLPMIESAYNPAAYSRARAAGMWQFIPSTGRKYGLQQTWWYDGRRDVLAATRAAMDYLQFLHDMFGDWELALAAYNCGEGAVQRAIAKNRRAGKPTGYRHLKLPRETRNYLPKLQAVKNIVADPALFKVALDPLPNQPYFAVVTAPPHIDVVMAAKLAGVPEEEFRYLNPGHQRPVITPVANRQLLVPADKVDLFNANLESNDQPLVTWQTYQLKKGETLDTVASKFDISLERLKEVNGLTGRKRVRTGQMLLVPLEHDEAETNLDETYANKDFQAPADDYHQRTIYRVKKGDTLGSIARRYHTSVSKLKAWNGLRGTMVRQGQRLTIWHYGAPAKKQRVARR
jgi:membrane-bound lytic murein transglycosylase D